ncbi:MAG: aspartate/glutamate racemase family protein [Alphaproteobacteria bacterium]
MTATILVINPNSDTEVTAHLDAVLAGLRHDGGPRIECATLAGAPKGIQTATDVAVVIGPLCRLVERRESEADAFVIACFGDPGVHAVRELTKKPVIGIGEAGLTAALSFGERIGIVTNLATDIAGHHRQNRSLGIADRVAGVRAVGIPVVGLADEAKGLPRMVEAGRALVEQDGAQVIVPACAGMARYNERLRRAVGVPVIDATVAAVGLALAAIGGAFTAVAEPAARRAAS